MRYQCPSCFSKSRTAHTLSFGPSHIVQQHLVGGPTQVSAQITGESRLCGGVSETSPQSEDTPSSGESTRSVHHGVKCDGCNQIVVGVRHKCLDCPGTSNDTCHTLLSHSRFRLRSLHCVHGIWSARTTQSVPRVFRYRYSRTCLCSYTPG